MREIRIPVPGRLTTTMVGLELPEPRVSLEYWVLLRDDARGVVLHPTSGRMVSAEVYDRLPAGEREHVHAWLRGLWD